MAVYLCDICDQWLDDDWHPMVEYLGCIMCDECEIEASADYEEQAEMNKLYLLIQDEQCSYDTYDSCVVVAASSEEAQKIRPDSCGWDKKDKYYSSWATKVENVDVTYLGLATSNLSAGEVVCASFNVG